LTVYTLNFTIGLQPVIFIFCCNSAIAAILVDNQWVASGSSVAVLQQILILT